MIEYYVTPKHPHAHLFEIRLWIKEPHPEGQILSLPNWNPGSYLIRDYARHIVSIEASSEEKSSSPLKITKINSNSWQCEKVKGPLEITYQVYAWDPSVRGAHLDANHGFFNGCCLFLCVKGKEKQKSRVLLSPPMLESQNWQVATTLMREEAPPRGFGWYYAHSYEELIDHPVEMGHIAFHVFEVGQTTHTLAISGRHQTLVQPLLQELAQICLVHQELFKEPPPFEEYLFLLRLTKDGYGGLEHRNSSALVASRDSVSALSIKEKSTAYINTLGLFSHEYFHAWNIKRIKPACFIPYDLDNKSYTFQLWAFEGITSYYDNLALKRAKVISVEQYLSVLSESLTRLLRNPGRMKQTVTESSFDAWTKFYQPNENSPNALVSYYTKGSFIALALDLALRLETNHTCSLDEVMLKLWQEYGKPNVGVPEGRIEEIIQELGSARLADLLHQALYDKADLPLAELFEPFGLSLTLRAAISSEDKGGKPSAKEKLETFSRGVLGCHYIKKIDRLVLTNILNDSAAEKAGLCSNDEIIAVDNLKVDANSIDSNMRLWEVGQKMMLHVFRADELMQVNVTLEAPFLDTAEITLQNNMTNTQKENLQRWLD